MIWWKVNKVDRNFVGRAYHKHEFIMLDMLKIKRDFETTQYRIMSFEEWLQSIESISVYDTRKVVSWIGGVYK